MGLDRYQNTAGGDLQSIIDNARPKPKEDKPMFDVYKKSKEDMFIPIIIEIKSYESLCDLRAAISCAVIRSTFPESMSNTQLEVLLNYLRAYK